MDNNLKLAEEYFRKARITDELLPNSIIKYRESIKRFTKGIGNKCFSKFEMADFDNYIFQEKKKEMMALE